MDRVGTGDAFLRISAVKHVLGEPLDPAGSYYGLAVYGEAESGYIDIVLALEGGGHAAIRGGLYTCCAISLTAGGDLLGAGAKRASASISLTDGGRLRAEGQHHTTDAGFQLGGGGHLYASWPIVLDPQIALRTNDSTVRAMRAEAGVRLNLNLSSVSLAVNLSAVTLDSEQGRTARLEHDLMSLTR